MRNDRTRAIPLKRDGQGDYIQRAFKPLGELEGSAKVMLRVGSVSHHKNQIRVDRGSGRCEKAI